MKIAILGTGGVGGYFGGKLAMAGEDVTFVARGAHLEAIKAKGLVVESVEGSFTVFPAKATDDVKAIGKVDLVISTVKAHQIKDIAPQIPSLIHENTLVLPLQNGIMAVEELSKFIDKKHIISGLCRIMSEIKAPGVINHMGAHKGRATIIFGEIDNSKSERVVMLNEVFENAGFGSKIADNITEEIWKKFLPICVGSLLALTRTTFGELREVPETRSLMKKMFNEIFELSQKMHVGLEEDIVDKNIEAIDHFPYASSASIVKDILAGKPSELDYQNGSVIYFAKKYGVNVPVNEFIYTCLVPSELKAKNLLKH